MLDSVDVTAHDHIDVLHTVDQCSLDDCFISLLVILDNRAQAVLPCSTQTLWVAPCWKEGHVGRKSTVFHVNRQDLLSTSWICIVKCMLSSI